MLAGEITAPSVCSPSEVIQTIKSREWNLNPYLSAVCHNPVSVWSQFSDFAS